MVEGCLHILRHVPILLSKFEYSWQHFYFTHDCHSSRPGCNFDPDQLKKVILTVTERLETGLEWRDSANIPILCGQAKRRRDPSSCMERFLFLSPPFKSSHLWPSKDAVEKLTVFEFDKIDLIGPPVSWVFRIILMWVWLNRSGVTVSSIIECSHPVARLLTQYVRTSSGSVLLILGILSSHFSVAIFSPLISIVSLPTYRFGILLGILV